MHNQAVTSKHTVIIVENLDTAIAEKLDAIQLKPRLKVSRRNLLSMPISMKRNELANQTLSRTLLRIAHAHKCLATGRTNGAINLRVVNGMNHVPNASINPQTESQPSRRNSTTMPLVPLRVPSERSEQVIANGFVCHA